MFFYFSKLAYFFLTPANWIFALLILLFFAKSSSLKKRLTIAVTVLVLFFGNEFIYVKLAYAWQRHPVKLPANTTYDAGIILGGIVSVDKNRNGFFNGASDRFIQASLLYKTGKIKKIIISGGPLDKYRPPEGDYLYQRFLELGIPASDLVVENKSRTTFENAAFTKKILDTLHIQQPLVLVTSAMHVPRAERVFNKAGIKVIPYPCNYTVLNKRFGFTEYFLPHVSTINSWGALLKEVVGLMAYDIFNKA